MSSPAYLEAKERRDALLQARADRAVELGATRVTLAQQRAVAASSERLQRIRAAFAESMAAATSRREVGLCLQCDACSDCGCVCLL
jgi:hypothetical protein